MRILLVIVCVMTVHVVLDATQVNFTSSIYLQKRISLSRTQNMVFPKMVEGVGGTIYTYTGVGIDGQPGQNAIFVVSGEPNKTFYVSTSSVTMSDGAGHSMSVTITVDPASPWTIGTGGTKTINLRGATTISSSKATHPKGTYTGTGTITVNY